MNDSRPSMKTMPRMATAWSNLNAGGRRSTKQAPATTPQTTGGAPMNESAEKPTIPRMLPMMSSR